MADINLDTTATIPSGASATVWVYEDTDNDGVADNVAEQAIGNGTNTYTLSGFDDSSGNDWWVYVQTQPGGVTQQVTIDSISLSQSVTVVNFVASGQAAGNKDRALDFGGLNSGDYVQIPDNPEMQITGDVTVAVTCSVPSDLDVDSNNNYRTVWAQNSTVSDTYGILFEESSSIDWTVTKGGSRENIRGGSIPMDGTTFTVVCTHDTSTGESIIYLDGTAVKTGTVATGSIDTVSAPWYISDFDSDHPFLGTIDHLVVDDKVWSSSEVSSYHNDAAFPTDPAAYFPLNDDSDTTTALEQQWHNDGAINGATYVDGLVGPATVSRARNFDGGGSADSTGTGALSAVFSLTADGAADGTGSAILNRARKFVASGAGDGTGVGGLTRLISFVASGSGDGTGDGGLSALFSLKADGSATGTGIAAIQGVKRSIVGVKDTLKDHIQIGTK